MQAIEFRTKIRNGIIEIPKKYRRKIKATVKVILLEEDITDTASDMIESLLESPLKLKSFTPFKREEIYDRS